MSITKVLNRWLNRLYKALAILLVLLAVAVSAFRLMLPNIDAYRDHLEAYLYHQYQLDVAIGQVSASWQGLNLNLVAKNIDLLQSTQANITIDQIDLNLDFWSSLQALTLVTDDFTLSGVNIYIDQTAIKRKQQSNETNVTETLENITQLFLSQIEHFLIKDSQLIIKVAEEQQLPIYINQVTWRNTNKQHNAQGEVVFGNLSSENLKLQLALIGETQEALVGNIYFEGNNLDITAWLGEQLNIASQDIHSAISFKSWLNIDKGQVQQAQLVLENSHVKWQEQQLEHQLALEKSQVIIKFEQGLDKFSLITSPIKLTLDGKAWQLFNGQFQQSNEAMFAYISALNLTDINKLTPLFINNESVLHYLNESSPQGTVNNLYMQRYQNRDQVLASFKNLSFSYSLGIPGVENLYGDLLIDGEKLQLELKAKQGEIDFDKHFIRPMPYQNLSATINGVMQKENWRFGIENLVFNSSELKLKGSLGISSSQGKSPRLALFAQVKDVAAANAKYYFPHLLMGENLVGYLNRGILAGKIPQAKVLFNGMLDRFPFEDHSGIFTVDAELVDSTFSFDPLWPSIENFHANLNFTNNSMLITGRSGNLQGIDVSGVTAEIKDLSGEQLLIINKKINNVEPQYITQLMLNSPLKETVGVTLEQVRLQKVINGHFSLELPLNHPADVVASGVVNFVDNEINLTTPSMFFNKVNGQLTFQNDTINIAELSLNWQNMPLQLSILGANKKDFYQTDIAITALWQQNQWQAQLPEIFTRYIKGDFNWQGKLSLFIPESGEFSYQLLANSTTKALQFNLPSPYQKNKDIVEKLSVEVQGQLTQSNINISLGDDLRFFGEFIHEGAHFSRAHLLLGQESMLLPMDGFHITAQLAKADITQWQPIVTDIIETIDAAQQNDSTFSFIPAPQRIRGSVDSLAIYGQNLTDVSFNLLAKEQWWLLQLNAKEARGEIKFFSDWFSQGIEVNADFITLNDFATLNNKEVDTSQQVFKAIPPMNVHCDRCKYKQLDFGRVDFSIKRTDDGLLELSNFIAQRDKTQLAFTGTWQQDEQQVKTTLAGKLKTKNIAREFEKLGYASTIKESGGNIQFKLFWQDTPFNFSLAKLNGDIKARIDDGYLAEVSDKGARIFSVLSLESLVRKLTLDFRDIFSDGMFYTYIKGDFHIKDGIIYTDNTKMKGAAGDLVMKGNTNLSTGNLDYHMSYKPNLTSSLPVLAWISTLDPVTFLAGIALDKVLTSSVVSEFQFELTGTVDKPLLKEVTRKTRDVTVGRSVPPKFIEKNEEVNQPINTTKEIPSESDKTNG